ncbi:zinc-dependent alcohol dehydrogenase family protein [Burkholderia sp. Ax-1719]|uniref:zinc-dependent alcohol dehydrogenase family protein n=1 Tax=Burkholderia sp. Ax-1719 TaxID=2608334 RepID=UPI001422BEE2|nr:zinc-dependent alcohol dehydrogenase family protein [Burkholderia sp. Ax-1719]NIE63114.1 alcohol dehydrogenase catalytic domain-containing protein [Burkholderia sp. Ax-1719]
MKIRAAVLEQSGMATPYAESRPLKIQTVDLAPPGPGEVLIRIAAAGICHSDLSVVDGVRPRPLPMVIGHEAAGVVEEVGPYVNDLQKGDHVVTVFVAACGHCNPCASGRPALCEPGGVAGSAGGLLGGGHRLSRDGVPLYHHSGVSAFAEYATVSRHSLVKVDRDIPLEEAALFGCAVLTGVGSAVNAARVQPGSQVAVIGLGGVGLAALLGAVAAGASRIVAIDVNDEKLTLAKVLGATDVFNAKTPDVAQAIIEATRGGVDTVLETAGAAAALDLGYTIARRGGELVTAGLPPPSTKFAIPAVSLVADEKSIRGSYLGSSVPSRDMPRYLDLYRRGRLPVDRLVTHRLKLDDINEGMDRLRLGAAVRQIVTM